MRHKFPASEQNIESLRNAPLSLGPGLFSGPKKEKVNAKEYYVDYSAKGCQLCGHYYRKKNSTYTHVDRHTHWKDELAPLKDAKYEGGKYEIRIQNHGKRYGDA